MGLQLQHGDGVVVRTGEPEGGNRGLVQENLARGVDVQDLDGLGHEPGVDAPAPRKEVRPVAGDSSFPQGSHQAGKKRPADSNVKGVFPGLIPAAKVQHE